MNINSFDKALIASRLPELSRINGVKVLFSDWYKIFSLRWGAKSVTMKLRTGGSLTFSSYEDYRNFWSTEKCARLLAKRLGIRISGNYVLWDGLRFYCATPDILVQSIGSIFSIFHSEEYGFMKVDGGIVIDVGANIGDTALWFSRQGAKKIIALEPYESSYNSAIKNIELNKMERKIEILKMAIGDKVRKVRIDQNTRNTGAKVLEETKQGKEIGVVTLKWLVEKYKLKDAYLKMDVEMAEYPAILSTSNGVLRSFKEMALEYHRGYLDLKEKLEGAGFRVIKKGMPSPGANGPQGLLYAVRKG